MGTFYSGLAYFYSRSVSSFEIEIFITDCYFHFSSRLNICMASHWGMMISVVNHWEMIMKATPMYANGVDDLYLPRMSVMPPLLPV